LDGLEEDALYRDEAAEGEERRRERWEMDA